MRFFKNAQGDEVFAFGDDPSEDPFIPSDLILITEAEANEIRTPVEKVRGRVWNAIKAKRDQIKGGGVKVGTRWFHTDPDSRIQHLGLKDRARDLIAAGGAMSDRLQVDIGTVETPNLIDIQWKTMSNSLIYVTAQMAFDIVAAIGNLDAKAHGTAEYHKANLDAAEDPAAYDFSAGWPDVYQA